MEPDDGPLPDLPDLLEAGHEAMPGPDPLRSIVARAGRRRRRMAAGGMAVALLIGGAVGYALANHSSSGTVTATAASPTTGAAAPAPGAPTPGAAARSPAVSGGSDSGVAGSAVGVGLSGQLTRFFTRTSGGVTIRVFRTSLPVPTGLAAGCVVGLPQLQVEVSTARMVGTTASGAVPAARTQPLAVTDAEVLGGPEGDPTAVVTAATGPTVAEVRVSFTGGSSDAMSPVDGWVALGGSVPAVLANGASIGTMTALDAAGRVVSSASLTQTGDPFGVGNESCHIYCPTTAKPAGSGAGGSTSAGAGGALPAKPVVNCATLPCATLPPAATSPSPNGAPVPAPLPAVKAGAAYACAMQGSGSTGGGSGSSGSASAGSISGTSAGAGAGTSGG